MRIIFFSPHQEFTVPRCYKHNFLLGWFTAGFLSGGCCLPCLHPEVRGQQCWVRTWPPYLWPPPTAPALICQHKRGRIECLTTRGIFHRRLHLHRSRSRRSVWRNLSRTNRCLPTHSFLEQGDILKGKTEGKWLDNMLDKVRDDQSFISVGADFSLMESYGVSAPHYSTKSPCGILIIQSQAEPFLKVAAKDIKVGHRCVCVWCFSCVTAV